MNICEVVKEWLSNEGYKYEIDQDGDIHFRYQGKNMYFTVSQDQDDKFFRIIMPNIYQIEDDRVKVLETCNMISRDIKVVKAFEVQGYMWLAIEMFVDSTPEINDYFELCCDILIAAFQRAAQEILN